MNNPDYFGPPTTCGHCGEPCGGGLIDPCLGHLPGVIGACCGHGTNQPYAPYVWFEDGRELSNREAVEAMRDLGGNPPDLDYPPMGRAPHLLSDVSKARA